MVRRMTPRKLRRLMNLWPPYLFSGVRIVAIAENWRRADVELRAHWWNRNYVGTHFGGSLFSMTDPFWMLLTMNALGRDFIVWDREGTIEFLKPGRGTVRASFVLEDRALEDIRRETASGGKYLHWFETDVIDGDGEVVARVRKRLYVRRKPLKTPPEAADGAETPGTDRISPTLE
jgi:acyl-coenzyme A thioesterase PaaI-like protein